MRDCSVPALVERGNERSDLLLSASIEVAVGEMQDVGEFFDFFENVWAGGKALENVRNRPSVVGGLPASVDLGGFAVA
jgi:hypothetical protein